MNMKIIYRKIAKEHGVTVEDVKRDMQSAIDYAYKKDNKSITEKRFQNSIQCKGDVPTIEEFLAEIVTKIDDLKI